ncbi:hypothetical protein Tco_0057642 [Tanacetum coccineum]
MRKPKRENVDQVDVLVLAIQKGNYGTCRGLIECLKADNTVRVNQIVTIFLIESSIHILDQNLYPVDTSLIHLESRKSLTKSLFDVGSRRIFIVTVNTKEYHSDVLEIITRIMRRMERIFKKRIKRKPKAKPSTEWKRPSQVKV